MNSQFLYRSALARVIQHLGFWGLSYYILVHIFASSSQVQPADHIYTAVFLVIIAIGTYFNLFILIPRFLVNGKYFAYGISLFMSVAAISFLNQLTFSGLIDYVLPGYYFISYYSFFDILKFMVAFTLITSLIKLSKGYFLLLETRNQLMQVQKEKSESELQALRAQVNPHFLFNALNSIYALVLKRSDKAAETILKLSGILRYMLYETGRNVGELSTEIEHMQEYINLQQLRCGQNAKIDVKISGEPNKRTIAPLLFLPLIENSFKHGIKGETGSVYVLIEWTIDATSVRFVAENNKGSADDIPMDHGHGIGLENLKKRLGMSYPGKHQFEITETDDSYKVDLLILTK
jgi:sensor histidine kinase YesM